MNNYVCINNYKDNSSYIKVFNGGILVVRFSVTYSYMGDTITKDSGSFTLGFSGKIDFPVGSTNIRIAIDILGFFQWIRIFTRSFSSLDKICFGVYGKLYYHQVEEIPCY